MGVDVVRMLLASVAMLACFAGVHRVAYRSGKFDGAASGYLMAIRDLCEGHLSVDGRTLIMDDTVGLLYSADTNKPIREIDMDELKFEED